MVAGVGWQGTTGRLYRSKEGGLEVGIIGKKGGNG